MWFRNTSLGQRLTLGFGIVVLLVMALVGAYAYGERQQDESLSRLTNQIMPVADAANDIATAYLLQSAGIRTYIYSGDERYLADYSRGVALAQDAMARLGRLPKTPEGNALLSQIQPLAVQFTQLADKGIALRREGKADEAQQSIVQEMLPTRNQLLEKTDAFVALQLRLRDGAKAETEQIQTATDRLAVAIAALVLLCAVLIGYLTARSVREPARALILASRALSQGDFQPAIGLAPEGGDLTARDEMRELSKAFSAMARTLLRWEKRREARMALSSALAANINASQLAQDALREIASYTASEFGLVYAYDEEAKLLRQLGSCALEDLPDVLKLGEGIPGEAAASRQRILVQDIPPDTPFQVRFGFDQVPPRTIVAEPVICQNQLVGVVVLGSLRNLSADALEFLQIAAQQLGVSLQNALTHNQVQALAKELQGKNELLSTQNEELQAQAEEIQAQNERLQSQSEEIQTQNEELQRQNEELHAQADEIQAQSEELATQNSELTRQAEQIARLQGITTHLSSSLSPEDVLEQVVKAASELLHSIFAGVLLLDESGAFFTPAAAIGLDEVEKATVRLGREESLAGQVVAEGRTLFIEDVQQRPEVRFPALLGKTAVGSLIVAPLRVAGESLGVVEVYFASPRSFSKEEVDLLTALAAAAAVAVHNSRLFAAARQQTRLLESVLTNIPEAVQVTNAQGQVVIANPAAKELFGAMELDGLKAALVESDGQAADSVLPELWRPTALALRGQVVLGWEIALPKTNDSYGNYAQVSAVPLFNDNGQVGSIVTVASDITQFKEIERLKDEFLSRASHELKSPLTSLKGFAQLLQMRMRSAPGYEAFQEPLQTIDGQVDKVVSLVNRLLDVSRAQMGRLEMKPEFLDLAELLKLQVQYVQVKTAAHRFVVDITGEANGYWDRGYLEQVLINLLENAVRYSPQGGEVRVSLHRTGEVVRISVADQGIGIPQEVLPSLFKRYFRSEEAKRICADGLGIGLYISQEIIAAHGGQIWAESELGRGSTFTIELPISQSVSMRN